MKQLRLILLLAFATPLFAALQPINVQKKGDGSNQLTGSIVVGNATSITASGNGTIAATTVPAAGVTGTLTNAQLGNASLTVAGHTIALGSAATLAASDLTNGTTGTGSVVLSNSPTLTTPNIGVATGTSVNLTGGVTAGGVSNFTNTTDSTNTTNGGAVFSGGIGVAKNLNVGGTSALSTTTVKGYDVTQSFTSREGRDYLYSDGAASNRRIETQYGSVGAVAGSDLTEVDYVFDVPTSNPSSSAYVFVIGSSNSFTPSNPGLVAWMLYCDLYSTGGLEIGARGASASTDYRSFVYPGFRAAYSGRRVRLTVAFSGNGTTNPVIYADGVDISSNFSLTTGGTPPNWVDSNLVATYHLSGYNWPAGYFRPGRPVNRKYAQSDVDFVQTTGRLPFSDTQGGNAAGIYNDAFASDPGGSYTTGPVGTKSYDSVNQELDITASAAGDAVYRQTFTKLVVGCRYLVTASLRNVVGGWNISNNIAGVVHSSTISSDGTISIEFTNVGSNAIAFSANSAGSASIYSFRVVQLGALSDPTIQSGTTLTDATPNGITSTLTGFTPVTRNTARQVYSGLQVGPTSGVSLTRLRHGTATLTAGNATISDTSVTANTRIFLTSNTAGGTPGWLRVSARSAGASFTITSSSATDTSTVAYLEIEP